MEELELYTGRLDYKDIQFTFIFDRKELRLIPPTEKQHEIEFVWGLKSLGQGIYTGPEPIPVGEDVLIGECGETRRKIVFLPQRGSNLSLYNSTVIIRLEAYIICKTDRDTIDRASFSCAEINYIHPANKAIKLAFQSEEWNNKGVVSVSTSDFDNTSTEKCFFSVDGKQVSSYFGITRSVSTNIQEAPLSVYSCLMFEFDPTADYRFIYRLWGIARQYIRFLCYRKNIFMPEIELSCPYEGGKHEKFATMYILGQDGEIEDETLKKGRYIKQAYINKHEGKILADIANDALYVRHLPDSFHAGREIDASRFIMIMAAFEWEFHRQYPDGVKKDETTVEAENHVADIIQEHIANTGGKQKKIFKFLKKLVRSDSLQTEIIQMGRDYSDIIGIFGERLYQLNDQVLKYTEMGQRLSDQRNHFAHGDLDKEFIGLSLLDLIYMEYVIYAMQLKYYGIDDNNIRKAINELFHLSFAI